MFVVEYRTISRLGITYPSRVATIRAHKATNATDASAYILRTTQNVEIIGVLYVEAA
jgi:hypothetical protein